MYENIELLQPFKRDKSQSYYWIDQQIDIVL